MDAFKIELVAESRVSGMTVSMVSKRHLVSTNQIYAWRQDARFQGGALEPDGNDFFEVGLIPDTAKAVPTTDQPNKRTSDTRIEITLENGRKLSISEGVDVSFVLELARGLF
jgi:transposase